jgi:putative transposase
MSVSDIEEQIREVYHFDISTSTISRIIESVANDIVSWQNRPLNSVYLIVCMDGIVFKVSESSNVVSKIICLVCCLEG